MIRPCWKSGASWEIAMKVVKRILRARASCSKGRSVFKMGIRVKWWNGRVTMRASRTIMEKNV